MTAMFVKSRTLASLTVYIHLLSTLKKNSYFKSAFQHFWFVSFIEFQIKIVLIQTELHELFLAGKLFSKFFKIINEKDNFGVGYILIELV